MRKNDRDRVTHKKSNRNSFKPCRCTIGIDQSYTRTGISVAIDGELVKIASDAFKGVTNKSAKRLRLSRDVDKVIKFCLKRVPKEDICIILEKIRTYTSGKDLRPDFLKSQGALIATIVDVAYTHGVKVWSVDTRHWKSRVLGSSLPVFDPVPGVKDPQKFGSVKKIIELGFEKELEVRRGASNQLVSLDDDAADSACIALYGSSGDPYQVWLEQ